MPLLALALAAAAHAQSAADWQFQGTVLAPDPGSSYANNSVGSSSVAWDYVNNQFLMVFESRTSTVDANCPNGVWDVGLATSPDGVTWTPQASPLLAPNPAANNFYSCVAAHPSIVFRTTTAQQVPSAYLYFKAEGWNGANNGIGVASIRFRASGTPYLRYVWSTPALPASAGHTWAMPKVVRQGSNWRMMVQDYPDIREFTSTSAVTFSGGGAVRLDFLTYKTPVVSWVVNEFFNPAYVCNDDPVGNQDLKLFPGARDTEYGQVVSGAWAKAVSNRSSINFVLDTTPQATWASDPEFRHWDVLGLTTGEYLIYFDEKDNSGNNFIRMGTTDPAWTSAQVRSRICP